MGILPQIISSEIELKWNRGNIVNEDSIQARIDGKRLERIIESSYDAIVIRDEAGKILFWNRGAQSLYGWAQKEVIGKITHQVFKTIFPHPLHVIEETLQNTGRWEGELIHHDRSGNTIIVDARWMMDADPEKRNSTVLEINRDITGRKKAEDLVVKTNENFENQVKLRTRELEAGNALLRKSQAILEDEKRNIIEASRLKSEFLANMSHEIRTPLNGILGMVEVIKDMNLPDEVRDCINIVQSSGENLLIIVNDILDLSKIEAGMMRLDIRDFNLSLTIEKALDGLAFRAHSKGLELAWFFEHPIPAALKGDPDRIVQILHNLVNNAIKFTEIGEVVIKISKSLETDHSIELCFEVKDTGIGIPKDRLSSLFQPFSQVDASTTRKYGGTGLGLKIAKSLVELMGGRIGVTSQPDEGSLFWFSLTLEKGTLPPPQSQRSYLQSDLEGIKVLIVDDNATNREVQQRQMENWRMRNGTANNGREALEILRQAVKQNDPYFLVLLDLQMPGMDGIETARIMKDDPELSKTHVILMSSTSRQLTSEERSKYGIHSQLVKPVKPSVLFDTIASLISREDTRGKTYPQVMENEQNKGHILIVEDNPANQEVVKRQLCRLGYSYELADNGRKALQLVEQHHFDAVLMDCQMPIMDGYEATQAIREHEKKRHTHIPIIALTAHAMEADRDLCISSGMDDYISKPVRLSSLKEKLGQYIAAKSSGKTPLDEFVDREYLMEQAEGDEGLMRDIVNSFLKYAAEQLKALREAAAQHNFPKIQKTSHMLKGSIGNITRGTAYQLVSEIEKAAINRNEEKLHLLEPILEKEIEKVVTACEEVLAQA